MSAATEAHLRGLKLDIQKAAGYRTSMSDRTLGGVQRDHAAREYFALSDRAFDAVAELARGKAFDCNGPLAQHLQDLS